MHGLTQLSPGLMQDGKPAAIRLAGIAQRVCLMRVDVALNDDDVFLWAWFSSS